MPRSDHAAAARARLHHSVRAAAALLLLMLAFPACSLAAAPAADEAYLAQLLGRWEISGAVRGRSVRYHARGERVLDGGFLRLHMVDAAEPPEYSADVFLGYDPNRHDFVVHWLDRFGAAGARVVATGTREGERLVVVFPYEAGAFRDTFTWEAARHGWRLLIEAEDRSGAWSVFADFRLERAARSGRRVDRPR